MAVSTKVTLLFAHGGGFCKSIWNPIIRRLRASHIVQAIPTDFVTFNFPYHGDKHDWAMLKSLEVDLSMPKAPRVWNTKHDLVGWVTGAVQEQVVTMKKKIEDDDREDKMQHKLIGVGHSIGSSGLWASEVANPGTFDGLILFEPVVAKNSTETESIIDFMVALTLQRNASWPSRAAAEKHFQNLGNFTKWDRETLAEYLCEGLVEADDGTVFLACHPTIEASLYCQKPFWLTGHELQQPKCPVTFHWGSCSKMWQRDQFQLYHEKLPHIYTMKEVMEGNSHLLVLEDPASAADRIVQDLAELEPYNAVMSDKTGRLH